MKSLTGNVTHYLFRNSDNGYSIAKIVLEKYGRSDHHRLFS